MNRRRRRRYRRSRKRRRRAIAAAQWGILIVLLAAWEILARTGVLDAFLLSCPSRVLESIATLARSGELGCTLRRRCGGTIIGFVLGAVLGVGGRGAALGGVLRSIEF